MQDVMYWTERELTLGDVLNCRGSTVGTCHAKVQSFYEELECTCNSSFINQQIYKKIARCHMKIPLENFNAKLGREVCFHTDDKEWRAYITLVMIMLLDQYALSHPTI